MADLARAHACPGERAESSIAAARLLLEAVDVAKSYAGIRALANGRRALSLPAAPGFSPGAVPWTELRRSSSI